ncbi:MAG TPA: hypothetical protein VLZ07_02435 [Syntrophales bacterium]|nr:hypothetical protein [Syntrophales bacterium]
MKRLIVLAAGLVFMFSAAVFAVDGPSQPSVKAGSKPPKETRVSIIGIVKEISDTTISVERTVRGETEVMEFALEKPVEKINVGDKVKINYLKRDGKNVATRVSPFVVKKIIKKTSPLKETRPTSPEASPPSK